MRAGAKLPVTALCLMRMADAVITKTGLLSAAIMNRHLTSFAVNGKRNASQPYQKNFSFIRKIANDDLGIYEQKPFYQHRFLLAVLSNYLQNISANCSRITYPQTRLAS